MFEEVNAWWREGRKERKRRQGSIVDWVIRVQEWKVEGVLYKVVIRVHD